MKKLIILLGLPLIFNTVFAQHTHNNVKLTRETKIIAITILAEARGEGQGGMYAVGAVIAQRAFERKRTPSEICLKPYQFSCWNGKKLKDLEHLLKVPQGKYALALAKNIKLLSRDFIGFANHYHNNKTEVFTVMKGKLRVLVQHIESDEIKEYVLDSSGKELDRIVVKPKYAHTFINIGKEEVVLLAWGNHIHDHSGPDQHKFVIKEK